MPKQQKTRIRAIALSLGAVLLLVPVTVSPGDAVTTNEACADGSCCAEINSTCDVDGDLVWNYYETSNETCAPITGM